MAAGALATLAAGTTSSALAQAPAVAGPAIEIEPKAPAILKGTSDRLAAAKTLAFKATVSEKSPSRLGPVLACTSRYDVVLQRPDKLRVTSPGDGAATDLPYNGKLLAAYAPATNLIATMPAPATIDAALLQGFKTASIYPPFTDLVVADPCKAIADGLRVAFYVGQATTVGGTTTDILVFGNDDVLIERWVGAQDRLPRTMRAVHLGDRQKVQHEMVLEDRNVDTTLPAAAFTPPPVAVSATYAVGAIYPAPPPETISVNENGAAYFIAGSAWFKPSYGANGMFYTGVPAP